MTKIDFLSDYHCRSNVFGHVFQNRDRQAIASSNNNIRTAHGDDNGEIFDVNPRFSTEVIGKHTAIATHIRQ